MANPGDVSAIVLAAGRSERFGSDNKLLATVSGKAVVRRTVEEAVQVPWLEVVVVTGWDATSVTAALKGLQVRTVENADFAAGMGSSVGAGVRSAESLAAGYLILLGDMPYVRAQTLERMVARLDRPDRIVVSRSSSWTGTPVLFGAAYRDRLSVLHGPLGASSVWKKATDLVDFEVEDDEHRDVDTESDLRR